MPRRKKEPPPNPNQPPLFDFGVLEKEPDKPHKLAISPNDIGGELLSILSKGLYTNPLDSIREYIQNAVDAKSDTVTIKFTGNTVTINDNGNGMSLDELLEARLFGMSPKSIVNNVGFRGIGLYSGFDICKRLIVTSKKRNEPHVYSLIIHFDEMKKRLANDKKKASTKGKISLIQLLSTHTFLQRDSLEVEKKAHFTQVTLYDLDDMHVRHLSNRTALRSYLLQNVPIDFADDFEHKKQINDTLNRHLSTYNAIKVVLQSDGQSDETVTKTSVPGLQAPQFGWIESSDRDEPLGYYWACMNDKRQRIKQNLELSSDIDDAVVPEGLVYKVKGFTIGDRSKIREFFTRQQVYRWVTGEVYVKDPEVIPNAERNNFETNNAKRALDFAMTEEMGRLEETILKFQKEGVAEERINQADEELKKIEQQILDNTQEDDFEIFSRLDQIKKSVGRQKGSAAPPIKSKGTKLLKRIDELKDSVRSQSGEKSEAERREKSAKRTKKSAQPVPIITPPPEEPVKTIDEVLNEGGWILEGSTAKLVEIFQSCVDDIVSPDKKLHKAFIDDLEAKASLD